MSGASRQPGAAAPRGHLLRSVLLVVLAAGFVLPVLFVILFAIVPPPVTPLMVIRSFEGDEVVSHWTPIEDISPHLVRAVLAAEDSRFCQHSGFDWDAIAEARQANERGGTLRGASTITQQTAKNLYLTPARNWLRKGAEAWFTVLIEAIWPKRRILEVYLNVAEWGAGPFGAEAAAMRYFGKRARDLNAYEAARLAAVLPNPREWRADAPGPYVAARTDTIIRRMGVIARSGYDACVWE